MSRKVVIYIAASLNNKIAAQDGSVEWLDTIPHPEGEDYGYYKFYDTIDTTVMGYSTYAQVKGWDIPFPYKDKQNYVVTRKTENQSDPDVKFITTEHVAFVRSLKETEGKNIWLVGGGKVNTMFLNAGLVDELIIHIMPIIMDGGIELFGDLPVIKNLKLLSSQTYESGVIELHYKVMNE